MEFTVEQAVKDLGIKCIGVRITGINNHHYSDSLNDYLNIHSQRLLKSSDVNDPIIQGFYDLHKKIGVSKRKNIPASENLIKLLKKRHDITRINPVVDIYNIISMESNLALGAHDIDKITGNVSLKLTDGKELFIPLGQEEPKEVPANVYSYIDDNNEIICYLEVRQVNKTKVTNDSKDIFFIVQGNEKTDYNYVKNVAGELITVITYYCGGTGKIL